MLARTSSLLFCIIALSWMAVPASADTREDWDKMRVFTPLNYMATQTAGRIKIDGKLDDRAWKNARWSEPHGVKPWGLL